MTFLFHIQLEQRPVIMLPTGILKVALGRPLSDIGGGRQETTSSFLAPGDAMAATPSFARTTIEL